MSVTAKLTSVAYKKGDWMRYTLWGLASICIVILFSTFFYVVNNEFSVAVPEGYIFSVTDNYGESSHLRTTYYVYKNSIFVENESFRPNSLDRTVLVYDNVSTDTLVLDASDTAELCELGSCQQVPKVLVVIKKLLSHQVGREYIGI